MCSCLFICTGEVLLRRYEALVSSSRLQPDQQQLTCLRHFQRLLDELAVYSPTLAAYEHNNQLYQVHERMRLLCNSCVFR